MLRDYWQFARANTRFIGFGFLLAFLSSAGQTYFIGVFGASIQAEFGLDSGSWGRTYMVGTLASAFLINWSGSLIDRVDLRYFTASVLLGLALACWFIASVSSVWMLIFAIFGLRHFGQGLTSHAGITSMARYHKADRGKAIALAAIGYAVGEALLPVVGLLASQVWGWRDTFRLVGLMVLLLTPCALWLLRGHRERHAAHHAELEIKRDLDPRNEDYSRRQVLSEGRFYMMLPAMIAPSMIGTALFFFPAEIAEAKGWSSIWITGHYWLFSVVSVTVTIYSGVWIDRYSARRVVPFFLLPLALALVVVNLSDHIAFIWPYMIFQALTSGLYFTGLSALWAELYGARFLGSIKSMTNAVMVFASALGPALVGSLLDLGVSFSAISWALAVFCLVATAMLWRTLQPKWDQPREGLGH